MEINLTNQDCVILCVISVFIIAVERLSCPRTAAGGAVSPPSAEL